jgi:enoyl-CoA hydratase/carnithine racemase
VNRKNNKYIEVKEEGQIATVTFNRPEKLNAVDEEMVLELDNVLDYMDHNSTTRVVIMKGSGDKVFVAGGDIKRLREMTVEEGERFVYLGQRVLNRLEYSNKIVIAAINGYAFGGGLEIALACDIRVASNKSVLGLPEVSVGLFPAWGGTQRLSRLIGTGLAKELIFTGDRISPERALQIGLVNHLVEHDQLDQKCREIAQKIINNSPISVVQAKKAINHGSEVSFDKALILEAEAWVVNFKTEDRVEGLSAFLERRKPVYVGK